MLDYTLRGTGGANANSDKYRTSAVEINCFGYTAGYKLMTGEGDAANDKPDSEGYMHHGEKNVHRMGLVYVGFSGLNIGYNSETIRDLLQNQLIHKPKQKKNPSSYFLWDKLNIPDRTYSQGGSSGGSSLWY